MSSKSPVLVSLLAFRSLLSGRRGGAILCAFALASCTATLPELGSFFGLNSEEPVVIPVGTIKPELDYSSESPECEIAAQRISENVQVGMTRKDVERLVGQPKLILAGAWHWTRGFTRTGRPIVKFQSSREQNSVFVSSFTAESNEC